MPVSARDSTVPHSRMLPYGKYPRAGPQFSMVRIALLIASPTRARGNNVGRNRLRNAAKKSPRSRPEKAVG
jgi:hypothetical protein